MLHKKLWPLVKFFLFFRVLIVFSFTFNFTLATSNRGQTFFLLLVGGCNMQAYYSHIYPLLHVELVYVCACSKAWKKNLKKISVYCHIVSHCIIVYTGYPKKNQRNVHEQVAFIIRFLYCVGMFTLGFKFTVKENYSDVNLKSLELTNRVKIC